jgi:hypothetical protein
VKVPRSFVETKSVNGENVMIGAIVVAVVEAVVLRVIAKLTKTRYAKGRL